MANNVEDEVVGRMSIRERMLWGMKEEGEWLKEGDGEEEWRGGGGGEGGGRG